MVVALICVVYAVLVGGLHSMHVTGKRGHAAMT